MVAACNEGEQGPWAAFLCARMTWVCTVSWSGDTFACAASGMWCRRRHPWRLLLRRGCSTWFDRPQRPTSGDLASAQLLLARVGIAPGTPFYFVAQVCGAWYNNWHVTHAHLLAMQTLGKVHPFFDEILVGILEGHPVARIVFIYDCAIDCFVAPCLASPIALCVVAGPAFDMLERRWNASAARVLRDAIGGKRIVAVQVCADGVVPWEITHGSGHRRCHCASSLALELTPLRVWTHFLSGCAAGRAHSWLVERHDVRHCVCRVASQRSSCCPSALQL